MILKTKRKKDSFEHSRKKRRGIMNDQYKEKRTRKKSFQKTRKEGKKRKKSFE